MVEGQDPIQQVIEAPQGLQFPPLRLYGDEQPVGPPPSKQEKDEQNRALEDRGVLPRVQEFSDKGTESSTKKYAIANPALAAAEMPKLLGTSIQQLMSKKDEDFHVAKVIRTEHGSVPVNILGPFEDFQILITPQKSGPELQIVLNKNHQPVSMQVVDDPTNIFSGLLRHAGQNELARNLPATDAKGCQQLIDKWKEEDKCPETERPLAEMRKGSGHAQVAWAQIAALYEKNRADYSFEGKFTQALKQAMIDENLMPMMAFENGRFAGIEAKAIDFNRDGHFGRDDLEKLTAINGSLGDRLYPIQQHVFAYLKEFTNPFADKLDAPTLGRAAEAFKNASVINEIYAPGYRRLGYSHQPGFAADIMADFAHKRSWVVFNNGFSKTHFTKAGLDAAEALFPSMSLAEHRVIADIRETFKDKLNGKGVTPAEIAAYAVQQRIERSKLSAAGGGIYAYRDNDGAAIPVPRR